MQTGNLYLIPSPLHAEALHCIPDYVKQITNQLTVFFVENERTARRYLRSSGFKTSFDEITMFPLNEHSSELEQTQFLKYLKNGKHCGLMSEAGIPAVADPGSVLVRLCHQNQVQVIPLCGPSSIILALSASGLNGQQFTFNGYIPIKNPERKDAILKMNAAALKGVTQICIETPYRNNTIIADFMQTCTEQISLCIASDITGPTEFIKTKTIQDWKKKIPKLEKIPAIFLLGN